MRLQQIWRYPVKSMAGEPLQRAYVSLSGIEGDRIVQVRNARGRVVTSRTHPALLGHHATLDAVGEPLIDGRPWSAPDVLAVIQRIAGPESRLVRDNSVERFDVLPLLIATDGAIAAFGRDGRRLRPNLVIGEVEGLEERTWPGSTLRIGEVLIAVEDLRARCVMTTFDPDTLAHDPQVLKDIVRRFEGKLALNCEVIHQGEVQVGQEVELLHAK
jgi:uncharacterized protein YcbX